MYTMEYHSAFKKEEVWSLMTTWMYLEDIKLREISQTEKDKYHMVSFTRREKEVQLIEME